MKDQIWKWIKRYGVTVWLTVAAIALLVSVSYAAYINLDLAITAANTAVDQLREQDYVGVVTFDDQYSWQLPITEASDKDAIHEKIQTVTEGGGTTIKPALRAALSEIKKSKADIRHVVLLTDGQGETRNFEDVICDYQEEGVTLSTVAVGTESDTRLLERLADQCDGRYGHRI